MNTVQNSTLTNFIQPNNLVWENCYHYYEQTGTSPNDIQTTLYNDEFSSEPKFINSTDFKQYQIPQNFLNFQCSNNTYTNVTPDWLSNLCTEMPCKTNFNTLSLPTVRSNCNTELETIYDDVTMANGTDKVNKKTTITDTSNISSPEPSCPEKVCQSPPSKFQCEICFKYFSKKYVLKRHLGTHNSFKTYNCAACKVGFHRKDIYDRHMKTKRCLKKHQAITTVKLAIDRACSNGLINSDIPFYFGFNCFRLAQPITTTATTATATTTTNTTTTTDTFTYHNILNQVPK